MGAAPSSMASSDIMPCLQDCCIKVIDGCPSGDVRGSVEACERLVQALGAVSSTGFSRSLTHCVIIQRGHEDTSAVHNYVKRCLSKVRYLCTANCSACCACNAVVNAARNAAAASLHVPSEVMCSSFEAILYGARPIICLRHDGASDRQLARALAEPWRAQQRGLARVAALAF